MAVTHLPAKVTPLLSACMIMRNESRALPRCLSSLAGVADEICVVDTGSTDDSVAIARAFGAKLRVAPWREDFSAARNEALAMAAGRWILVIDADEAVCRQDGPKLRALLASSGLEAYFVQVLSYIGQERVDHLVRHQVVRLFRNRPPYQYRGKVHEGLDLSAARAMVAISDIRLMHYGYLEDVKRRTGKAERNLTLLSRALAADYANPYLHFNIGTESLNRGEYETALTHFEEAARNVRPEHIYAPLLAKRRICCLQALGQHLRAAELAEQAHDEFPHYTDLVFLKAVSLLHLGRLPAALQAFKTCTELGEPVDVPRPSEEVGVGTFKAFWWIGQIHERMHRPPEAIEAYRKALAHEPQHRASLERLIGLLRERLSEEEAARALELPPEHEASLQDALNVFGERGEYNALLTLLSDVAITRTPPGITRYWQGVTLVRVGRISEGLACLQSVSDESPLAERSLLEQAVAAWLEQDFARAQGVIERCQQAFGDSTAVSVYSAVHRCLIEDGMPNVPLPRTEEARICLLHLAHAFRACGQLNALLRLAAAALSSFGHGIRADFARLLVPARCCSPDSGGDEPLRAQSALVELLLTDSERQDLTFDDWMALARLARCHGRLARALAYYARASRADTCWAKSYLEPAWALLEQVQRVVRAAVLRFPGAEPLAKLAGLLAPEGGAPTGGLGT